MSAPLKPVTDDDYLAKLIRLEVQDLNYLIAKAYDVGITQRFLGLQHIEGGHELHLDRHPELRISIRRVQEL
jgi:hypothetical protein